MMIVVVIIGIASAMLFLGTRHQRRGLQVRIEAEKLASVLRQARGMAMDQKAIFGVAFNITNAPDSSGRVLNNRSGGHWYRIIGPTSSSGDEDVQWSGVGSYTGPLICNRDLVTAIDRQDMVLLGNRGLEAIDRPVSYPLINGIASDWAGPKEYLPKGLVRFLALSDEDNGNNRAPGHFFKDGFPRPWFGEWNPTNKRLYAWGGYDPEIKDFAQPGPLPWAVQTGPRQSAGGGTISYTGFYYEGQDGPVSGCRNQVDRIVYSDKDGKKFVDVAGGDQINYTLWKAGDPRPLVNGDWLDAYILFFPDGSARFGPWCSIRHQYSEYSANPNVLFNEDFTHLQSKLAMGDMCNNINPWRETTTPANCAGEASHFTGRTGRWYITLAPDVDNDTVIYDTAQQALASMLPMWRVGISRSGEVSVIKVRQFLPPGTRLDVGHAGASYYEGPPPGLNGYYDDVLTTVAGGLQMPAEDFVTAEMLTNRSWWLN